MSQDKVSQQAAKNSQTLNITLLGSEWKSSKGGLSTLNRELAIYLSRIQNVRVSLFVPEGTCTSDDKREAGRLGINILEATKCVGLDPLVWLSNPPQGHRMDVIIGHGVKLGCQVQLVKRNVQFRNCKWVHVVHTAPEEISKFKDYDSPISKGEKKHWDEVELCRCADLIVTVGPKLREIYDSYLQSFKIIDEDVFELIPGLFDREFEGLRLRANVEKNRFEVLLCGRGDEEDFELKGYKIAVKALADLRQNKGKHYFLRFVGAPAEKQDEVREKLLNCGIAPVDKDLLTVRKFVESREGMKDLLSEIDMVIMPSKSEGFGLVAVEALSAGLPILVGRNSGFAKAIETIPLGEYFIVDSEDPAKWAEAIERVRARHMLILQEIELLKEQYSKKYCWKRQCEELVDILREMVCGVTSTAQVAAADDWTEKQPRTITESVCQHQMEAGNRRAKVLSKRRISESEAECVLWNSDDWVEKQPRTITAPVCQRHMEAGSKRAKKLSRRIILESEADYGVTSTAQVAAADDWTEKQPRTITESVCQHQMEAGNRRAKVLSKRRISESEAECGTFAFLLLFSPQNAIHWRQKEFFVLAYFHKF
ncbi:PREDICTED: uncharacterized protein LOC107327825 [Acropora digitifera]|uniref:uncharacterized protein LOC107327825 n=1 Tax=Acropora digitifera TaxID=70779 RepID=UPI00077AECF0|nr:PREDICTED: uncharacterized protein LOC107327825 [Acropora digitifera]